MTVRELETRLFSDELTEWIAYSELEPFGERHADVRFALLSCLTANIHRDPKKQAYELYDFMPWLHETDRPRQTMEQQIMLASMITEALGGRDKRGN